MSKSDLEACHHYAKINNCALGMGIGLTWGLGMFILTWLFIWFDIGGALLEAMGSIYIGFKGTCWGSFVGLFWGIVNGYIAGIIVGFFYNLSLKHCPVCNCFCCKKK